MMVSFVGRGQWRYRTHKMITLPEMFWDWKHQCTATEIYFWHTHALKCIKKRSHSKVPGDRRDAALLRRAETGRYGFPREQ